MYVMPTVDANIVTAKKHCPTLAAELRIENQEALPKFEIQKKSDTFAMASISRAALNDCIRLEPNEA